MGGEISSVSYDRVPNAVLVFGPTKDNGAALEKLRLTVSTLNDIVSKIHGAVQLGSKYIEFFANTSPYTALAVQFFSILNKLIAESEALNKALNDLEQNIYSTLLDGKLSALTNHLATIQDTKTSSEQKMMELVSAISHFHEILPIFTRRDSILYRKYYIGAQLFVPFCGLFKLMITIADNTANYNNPGLNNLKENYRDVLKSFKHRCIGQRLNSTYMITRFVTRQSIQDYDEYYFNDLQQFPEYIGSTSG